MDAKTEELIFEYAAMMKTVDSFVGMTEDRELLLDQELYQRFGNMCRDARNEETEQIEELMSDLEMIDGKSPVFCSMRNMHIEPTKILFECKQERWLSALAYLRGPKTSYWTDARVAAARSVCYEKLGFVLSMIKFRDFAWKTNSKEAVEIWRFLCDEIDFDAENKKAI